MIAQVANVAQGCPQVRTDLHGLSVPDSTDVTNVYWVLRLSEGRWKRWSSVGLVGTVGIGGDRWESVGTGEPNRGDRPLQVPTEFTDFAVSMGVGSRRNYCALPCQYS